MSTDQKFVHNAFLMDIVVTQQVTPVGSRKQKVLDQP